MLEKVEKVELYERVLEGSKLLLCDRGGAVQRGIEINVCGLKIEGMEGFSAQDQRCLDNVSFSILPCASLGSTFLSLIQHKPPIAHNFL